MKKNILKPFVAGIFFSIALLYASVIFGQQTYLKLHHEVQNDKYMPPDANRETSEAYHTSSRFYFTQQVNVNSNGENIENDAANEPSIAINLQNPNIILIGWRQFDNVQSDFRQAGYGYSTDGGHTWTFPGVIEAGVFRSDPVLSFDNNGTFYYNSLTVDQAQNMTCQVFRSTTGGSSWDNGVDAQGGDKQWMIIDRTNSIGQGNIYASWTSYYSYCFPGFFTRSTNGGDSYENCVTVDGNPHWGTLAVGLNGILFAAGIDDGGNFVISKSTTAKDPSTVVNWQFNTNVDLGGYMQNNDGPNPAGLKGQVWVAADTSNGPGRGNVYMLCSIKPNYSNDPCDVMFARSTDNGETWDDPVRINDDATNNGAWQWFGTMSVAPNGRIDVVWLDTRNNPGTYLSSLYYSSSFNQGQTWATNQRISDAFDPHVGWPQQQKMGDYFHMVSLNDAAYLAWANTLNGEQDVYFTKIYAGLDNVAQNNSFDKPAFSNYPNPFKNKTTFRYSVLKNELVQIIVTDMFGKPIAILLNKNKKAGNYLLDWNVSNVPNGMYICRLIENNSVRTLKLLHFN